MTQINVARLYVQIADSMGIELVVNPTDQRPVSVTPMLFHAVVKKSFQFLVRVRMRAIQWVQLDISLSEIQDARWIHEVHFDDEQIVVIAHEPGYVEVSYPVYFHVRKVLVTLKFTLVVQLFLETFDGRVACSPNESILTMT